jgi:hypothetical protein
MPFFLDMSTRSDFMLSHLVRDVMRSPLLPMITDTTSGESQSMHVIVARITQYFGFALAVEHNMRPKSALAILSLKIYDMLMLTPHLYY